jgi:hypothetical protein
MIACAPIARAQTSAPSGLTAVDEERARAREDTYETARGIGMGTGGRAGASGTSAVAYNAANLSLACVYHVETAFGYVPGDNAYSTGGAVIDSVTSSLALGFSFRGVIGGGDRDYSGWDGRLSAAYSITGMISLGLGARFMKLRPGDRTDDGQPIGPRARGFTIDASLRITPIEGVHIAALAYNLVDRHSALVPMMVGGGLSLTMVEGLDISGDCLVDLTTFTSAEVVVGGGPEYLAGEQVPLRIGYRRDQGRDIHSITASIGSLDAKFGIDLAMRQDFGGQTASQLLLALRYHVQ